MSERAPTQNFETLTLPDAAHAEALRPGEANPELAPENKAEAVAEARSVVAEQSHAEATSNLMDSLNAAAESAPAPAPTQINRDLKNITLRRELNTIRRKLPMADRALSKVIHQPAVRVVSETAGKTVSRPSGLLGGGIVSLLGTSSYLYLAKHLGFQYNYGVFLALFVGGFALGLALELIVHLATKSRRSAQ